MNNLSCRILWTVLLSIGAISVPTIQARLVTNFESPPYETGNTIVDITDPSASKQWEELFSGSRSESTVSTVHPLSGTRHLRIVDSSTSLARGVGINLGDGVFDTGSGAADITIAFAFSISADVSPDTENQVQFFFGTKSTDYTKNWFGLAYNNGNLYLRVNSSSGIASEWMNVSQYTAISNLGDYIKVEVVIDPESQKYKSVRFLGTLGDVDVTSVVQSSGSAGSIPHHAAALNDLPNWFSIVIGGNDTLTLDVDDISITQAPIPEPANIAVLVAGVLFVCAVCRRNK